MLSCCIEGCESYKFTNKQKIGYFQFPLDNKLLLNKWLDQIRLPNWHPTDKDQICSTHFLVDDIDFRPIKPKLNSKAVPMIFPLKHFDYIYADNKTSDSNNHSEHQIERINVPSVKNAKNVSTVQMNSNSLIQKDNIQNDKSTAGSSHPKPYILIISDENQTKIPLNNSRPSKKELGVLRIQIDKKINNAIPSGSTKNSLTDENNSNQETNQRLCKDRPVEEVEINDTLSSKVVVFKFDPTSGKITVTKKDKIEKDNEIPNENGNIEKSVTINENNSSNSHSLNESLSEKRIESQNNSDDSSKNKQNNITEKDKNIIDIDKNIQNSNSTQNKQRNQKKKLNESINTVEKEIIDIDKNIQNSNSAQNKQRNPKKNVHESITVEQEIIDIDKNIQNSNSAQNKQRNPKKKLNESIITVGKEIIDIDKNIQNSNSAQNKQRNPKNKLNESIITVEKEIIEIDKNIQNSNSTQNKQRNPKKKLNESIITVDKEIKDIKPLKIPITSEDSQSSQVNTNSQTNKLDENGQKVHAKMDTKLSNNSSPNSYLCVVLNNISQKRKPDMTTNSSSTKNTKILKKI